MNLLYDSKIDKVYQYLLIVLAFVLPLTVAGGNVFIGLIVIIWLLSGDYRLKFNQIKNSKLAVASLLFFAVHVIGLLWTNNMEWGFHIVKKMQDFFIFLPILLTITKKENIEHYVFAFLLAIATTIVLSYFVWFEIIPPFKNATIDNPTPFTSHISHNPILAFAAYLVGHRLLFSVNLEKYKKYFFIVFFISIGVNMFITGGRAGQVGYFVLIFILFYQFYRGGIKAMFMSFIFVASIFFTAYIASDLFNSRVNSAINNLITYQNVRYTPVGERLAFALNSLEIIKNNILFGVGTGDFPDEYQKINEKMTPELTNASNPHNMYTLLLVQLGLFGLASLFYLLYTQIKFALSSKDKFLSDVGVSLPALFIVIMLSDSYLLGHYTTFLFIFFSSFLYKDFEKT